MISLKIIDLILLIRYLHSNLLKSTRFKLLSLRSLFSREILKFIISKMLIILSTTFSTLKILSLLTSCKIFKKDTTNLYVSSIVFSTLIERNFEIFSNILLTFLLDLSNCSYLLKKLDLNDYIYPPPYYI